MDADAWAEAGDHLRKARKEGTIADQRINPPGRYQYVFTPIVNIELREDGLLQVDLDWSDSYQYRYDTVTGEDNAGNHGDGDDEEAICLALDRAVNATGGAFPKRVFINA